MDSKKTFRHFKEYISGVVMKPDGLDDDTAKELIELFDCFSHFYGVIPIKKVYEIITENFGLALSEEAFLAFCDFVRAMDPKLYYYVLGREEITDADAEITTAPFDRELIFESYIAVDEEDFWRIVELKKGKPWYIPEREYLLSCGADEDYERTPQYNAMLEFFRKQLSIGRREADELMQEIAIGLSSEFNDFDHVLNDIQRLGYDLSFEQTEALIPYFIELNNNTRIPANNGYTPAEAEALREEYGFDGDTFFIGEVSFDREKELKRKAECALRCQMMRLEFDDDDHFDEDDYAVFEDIENRLEQLEKPQPVRVTKIGRNDPCPCGSGKKYKKCCGR